MSTARRVDHPRRAERNTDDQTLGYGQPPHGVTGGRVFARLRIRLSCQLCPDSPTYWRHQEATL
jgi:ribosomal protein L44E